MNKQINCKQTDAHKPRAGNFGFPGYAMENMGGFMTTDDAHLVLKIDTKAPVELNDFVAAFVGFGNQFDRFHDREYPSESHDAGFYVREVRAGSIIAELVPYIGATAPVLGGIMAGVKHANDLKKFVENYGASLKKYFKRGGRESLAMRASHVDAAA
jgi:hypothetical protein